MVNSMKISQKVTKIPYKPYFLPLWGSSPCHPQYDWSPILMSWTTRRQSFPEDTLLIMESGGAAQQKAKNEKACLKKQSELKADIGFMLDDPVKIRYVGADYTKLHAHWMTEKSKVIEVNLNYAKNTLRLKKEMNLDLEVMCIIHSYNKNSLYYMTSELYSMGFDYFALSEVTYLGHLTREGWEETQNTFLCRDILGKGCWIHLLGVTNPKILTKVKNVIDSFDSSKNLTAAKHGTLITETGRHVPVGFRQKKGSPVAGYTHYNPEFGELRVRNKSLVNDLPTEQYIDMLSSLTASQRTMLLVETNFLNLVKFYKKVLWR